MQWLLVPFRTQISLQISSLTNLRACCRIIHIIVTVSDTSGTLNQPKMGLRQIEQAFSSYFAIYIWRFFKVSSIWQKMKKNLVQLDFPFLYGTSKTRNPSWLWVPDLSLTTVVQWKIVLKMMMIMVRWLVCWFQKVLIIESCTKKIDVVRNKNNNFRLVCVRWRQNDAAVRRRWMLRVNFSINSKLPAYYIFLHMML